jgi:sulfur-oxidizing protein SoxX
MRSSFQSKGQVTVDAVIARDATQRVCSRPQSEIDSKDTSEIQADAARAIVYPEDDNYLGDWKKGEQIAQSGRGLQFSDLSSAENGGNCYACHRLSASEVSFGTVGPSLYQYGKLRGSHADALKYAWAKISDPHTFQPCSIMPRFGRHHILSPQQIRDVMALLFDPGSPVNQ